MKLGEMYTNAGRQHQVAGRTDEANASLDAAIELFREWAAAEPGYKTAHEKLCEACRYRGFLAEALKHNRIAINIVPNYGPHHDTHLKLALQL